MTTPSKAFRQGIFDIIVERGSAMKKRCLDRYGNCAYRDGNGNSCWVGLVLSDEEALNKDGKPHIGGVASLVADGVLPERYKGHTELLFDLQRIHDDYQNWENVDDGVRTDYGHGAPKRERIAEALRSVAFKWGLNANTVDQFYPA